MVTIINFSATTFKLNGIEYQKNFNSIVTNDNIKIIGVYDSKIILKNNTNFSYFTVDGISYASAILLQSALVNILFTKTSLILDSLYLGFFNTSAELIAAHPTAISGNYAVVGATDTVWIWDIDTTAWVDSGNPQGLIPINSVGVPELKPELKYKIELGNSSGTLAIDWNKGITYTLTMIGDTSLTDLNLYTGSIVKKITIYVDGIYNLTLPYYWESISGNFDNSKVNKITAELINGNVGSELVYYSVENSSKDLSWDLANAVLTKTTDISSISSSNSGVFFKPDGTKMYLIESVVDSIHEFNLTTPWDTATMVFVQSKSVLTEDSLPLSITFKPDGTKLYMVGGTGDDINEYNLTTPWDISTLTFVQIYDPAAQDLIPANVFFKPDGTKMYMSGAGNVSIYEYNLATPWDLSTVTYIQLLNISSKVTSIWEAHFKYDGTKMYVVDDITTDSIHEYNLTLAWDISTGVFSKTLIDTSGSSRGMFFKPNGLKLYHLYTNFINELDLK